MKKFAVLLLCSAMVLNVSLPVAAQSTGTAAGSASTAVSGAGSGASGSSSEANTSSGNSSAAKAAAGSSSTANTATGSSSTAKASSAGSSAAAASSAESEQVKAARTIFEQAGGAQSGNDIVGTVASSVMDDAGTQAALKVIKDGVLAKVTASGEEDTTAPYHFSGAGLRAAQIDSNARALMQYMEKNGSKAEDSGKKGAYTYTISGDDTDSQGKYTIVYQPANKRIQFGYLVSGTDSTAAVVMQFSTDDYSVKSVQAAVTGKVKDADDFLLTYEIPFSKMLSTDLDSLNYTETYSNLSKTYSGELAREARAFGEAAFDSWEKALTSQQSVGLGEIGFGAYDVHGWFQTADGDWMYMLDNGTYPSGRWDKISGQQYYFDGEGVMQTGWVQAGGKWYYCGDDGAMQTGWVTVGSRKYYLGTDGVMVTGKQTIEGKQYTFGSDGVLKEG